MTRIVRASGVFILGFGIAALATLLFGCDVQPSSSDRTRDAQEKLVNEGVSQAGVPAIKNFRELKLLKEIYELRDQTGLVTYTYLWNEFNGKLVFLCNSVGYGIPYATQYSAPSSVQRWYLAQKDDWQRAWGQQQLPQAEPNGLFMPGAAEGTWVLCKDPHGDKTRPLYIEPRVIVSPFPLQ